MSNNTNNSGYFHEVMQKTPTNFWINSAIQGEIEDALNWGAKGCTLNPTHPPKAIIKDSGLWQPVIDRIIKDYPLLPDDEVADLLLQDMIKRTSSLFLPLYEKSKGEFGHAAIQSNPNTNDELETLIRHAVCYSRIAPNVVPKIPSTKIGAQAVESLTAMGINTIATMGFSVSQAIAMAEAYERGLKYLKASNPGPRCFVVIIPGVFDDYLIETAKKLGNEDIIGLIRFAGNFWCQIVYKIFQERAYKADLLVGGTRETYHVSSFIGGKLHLTHSHNTWKDLASANPPIVEEISKETSPEIIAKLKDDFIDFRRACEVDGLMPHEFKSFGPCVKFNNACIDGYSQTKLQIQAERIRFNKS